MDGEIQPGSWHKAGTHRLSVGKDTGARTSGNGVKAGAKVTGGRTSNIVGMLGPELPMDVPAALCECRDQSLDSRAGTHRKGNQPQNWRATGQVPRYFLTLSGPSRSFLSGPTACRKSLAWYAVHHTQVPPRAVLVFLWYRLVLSSVFSVLVVSFLPCSRLRF